MDDLSQQLLGVAEKIERPREQDGTPATLEALMPCEPAVGQVAVACWTDSEGGELIELVRLADAARVDDRVALREALTLLAMVETLEEVASFDELEALGEALATWQPDEREPLPDQFARSRANALQALSTLRALAPGDEPRMARPQLLDELGGALRELERAWESLEQAAELWSDSLLASHPDDSSALEHVQELWRLLGSARRGPLLRPPSAALHAGREAGAAMAASVLDAAPADPDG